MVDFVGVNVYCLGMAEETTNAPPRKNPVEQRGQRIRYIRIEDPVILEQLFIEKTAAGDKTVTGCAMRLLKEGIIRAKVERETTGSLMAAAMNQTQEPRR